MSRFTRRRFLHTSLAAGAVAAFGAPRASARALGANERIRVAIAGLNGRGRAHISEFAKREDVEIAYLVDPDTRTFAGALRQVEQAAGHRPKTLTDVRAALDDPELNVVSIASPNHWHALTTVWACQAGKDVYVEKPLSHNVHEGRIAVEAARRYGCIVQHGTQNRSSGGWSRIMAVIASGAFGPLRVARGLCYKKRPSIGVRNAATPPSELDFNLWVGPAADQPYHPNLVHYNWHWFWDFGNGDIGNQGVHEIDLARWGIPGATLPKSVISVGGRFGYTDQGETANTQVTVFDYGPTQLIFEVRGLVQKNDVTALFHFDDGTIRSDGQFYRNGSDQGEPLPEVEHGRGPGGGNFGNFLAAVRSRNVQDLNADVLEGHYSSALCHLANVSYRLGEETPFDAKRRAFAGNEAASATFAAMEEHLAKENGLRLSDLKYRLGRFLEFDAETERFVDDDEANALLTRPYREPFVVPERIA